MKYVSITLLGSFFDDEREAPCTSKYASFYFFCGTHARINGHSQTAACNSANIPTYFCGTFSSSSKSYSRGHRYQRNLGRYPSESHNFRPPLYPLVPSIRICGCCGKRGVLLCQRNGTAICNSSGYHHARFICMPPNQQETHMRIDIFHIKMYLPVAVVVIIALVSTVEQSIVAIISASMIVSITTGGPNLTIEVAEAELTVDRNGKQTSKDRDGEKRDLHIRFDSFFVERL